MFPFSSVRFILACLMLCWHLRSSLKNTGIVARLGIHLTFSLNASLNKLHGIIVMK